MTEQLISQLVDTIENLATPNNQIRMQAETYLKQAEVTQSFVQSLFYIITHPECAKGGNQYIQNQAALILKSKVAKGWNQDDSKNDQENINFNQQKQTTNFYPLNEDDKTFLKTNIFQAIDSCNDKIIMNCLENILFVIAENENLVQWQYGLLQIHDRLKSNDERIQISGLIALKNIIESLQYELEEDREELNQLVNIFFPVIENLLQMSNQAANSVQIMTMISKVFYCANELKICPYLMQQGRLNQWVGFFKMILDTSLGEQYEQLTESAQQIHELDKTPYWKLKGIVAQITMKLYQKYGNVNTAKSDPATATFCADFDQNYAWPLLESHLNIVLLRRQRFIGTKTLCCSLKLMCSVLKAQRTRNMMVDKIPQILYEVCLPMMLISEKEFNVYHENPIEYVRMQVDQSNPYYIKKYVRQLISTICCIKASKQQQAKFLNCLLGKIAINFDNAAKSNDFREKEATLHVFGVLIDLLNKDKEQRDYIEPILFNQVYPELLSDNALMRARAIWVYGQCGSVSFKKQHELRLALEAIYQNLQHEQLPVRVEAALALSNLLSHEEGVQFVRPGLQVILQTYLKIMDDIDFDDLISALQEIVEVFEDEIAPYAVGLCQKLSEAYIRLIQLKGEGEEEDQESCLSADGLITAIRRVLTSIQGKYKHEYPKLEEILEQPLLYCLSEEGKTSAEEALTCISQLIYNQDQISPRMWNFYQVITNLINNNSGIIDEFLPQAAVPLINYMTKDPETFRTASFNGQSTCLDIMFGLIGKIFTMSKENEDEIMAMTGVNLINSLLEAINGIHANLGSIIQYLLTELQTCKTPEYRLSLIQGVCMTIHYSPLQTMEILQQLGALDPIINLIFENIQRVKVDIQFKRIIYGLMGLLNDGGDASQLPQTVQNQSGNIAKALIYLCSQSINLTIKELTKQPKKPQVEEEEDESIYENDQEDIIEDEDDEDDEDYDCEEEVQELYDSKFDQVDEVLAVNQFFDGMKNSNPEMYNYLMSQLTPDEQNQFAQAVGKSIEIQQLSQQQQQQ